ncbi:Smr domain-containing protein [Cyclobacterium lianum]|uniref:Smr domain-containing protein n=1 Tax=Cyclobacterium lianum TaxID=388280 RepID=A0A1M7QCV9_9BACT|nr:Smr/MutS family protein [Cyclobacterium lianum]SHN28527.1 Smr domain-containing protein [Cyclobacterium lianum]
MNIGDKVRLLHGREEGIITRLSAGGQVEIEIEDGFRIPALKSEVVVIDAAEKEYFDRPGVETNAFEPPVQKTLPAASTEGIFLAYVPYNDQLHDLVLINHSQKPCLFAVDELSGEKVKNLEAGVLQAESFRKISERTLQDFEQWPALKFLLIPLNKKFDAPQAAMERKVKFKATQFFKHKGKAPLIGKESYFFQLDLREKALDVKKLNEALNPVAKDAFPHVQPKRPPASVDLHIEKLSREHDLMSNSEKLQLQMEVFQKMLNDAMTSGMDEITFIHGIGNGVLRKEIHRFLSQVNGIKYFKDSQKTNFGYGATTVKIHE